MKNKRILFFAPNFFGYELAIKKELEKLGAIVDFYDDRPSNSVMSKLLIRINPKFARNSIHKYFEKIIKENKNHIYDYVFFIKCEAALEKDLRHLKKTFGNAEFILYLYDSLSNIKYYDMKKKYFDKIFSFDMENVAKNKEMSFRPLFYLDEYKKNTIFGKCKYDLAFIGTAHSDRPKVINKLRKKMEEMGCTCYFRLYVPSKLVFIIKRLCNKNFRELDNNNCITLQKVSAKEVSDIVNNSNVILDIQHPKQSGLTIRTIELLGMNKKMITTNYYIRNYEFYDSNNIAIIDRKKPKINNVFFSTQYMIIQKEIYEYYSIHSWITEIFNIDKEELE